MEARRRRVSRRGCACRRDRDRCIAVPALAMAALAIIPGTPGREPAGLTRRTIPSSTDVRAPTTRRAADARLRDLRRRGLSASSASALTARSIALGLYAHPLCRLRSARRSRAKRPTSPPSANPLTGVARCSQIAGIRADTAWKYSTGDPDVAVAILDTGIRWQDRELVNKVHLNAAELPPPQHADGGDCACRRLQRRRCLQRRRLRRRPSRARSPMATASPTTILDASDLIARFSDDTDADANGFVDDIAGWDFFDDDNDPFDASSCCSANGHGTGRAKEAVAETDNGDRQPGRLPELPVHAAARLGHLRRPDRQLRDGRRSTRPTTARASSRAPSAASRNTQFARSAFDLRRRRRASR